MFTGIIEEIGRVKAIQKGSRSIVLQIEAEKITEDLKVGDSIAVNGVCLTATSFQKHDFTADVMPETLHRSSLGVLTVGSPVNLERAMAANGRFGGHIVTGHIDGTAVIREIKREDNAVWYTIAAESKLMRYIIEKGSVAIDGISLTVACVSPDTFQVSIIPHTLGETILGKKKKGDIVNIENDCVGKYIEHFLKAIPEQEKNSGITREFLLQNGF